MKNPKISIIVPVYNAERYLRQCIDSIIAQSFSEWEAILVDDGSKDYSGAICDEYAKKDNRFVVVHKPNGGVSSARNLGLEKASGEWLLFCDSDDLLYNNTLETFLLYAQPNVESICGGYIKIDDKGNSILNSQIEYGLSVSRDKALIDFYQHVWGDMFNGYLWNRLLRNNVVKNNGIKFREDIYIKEDGLFLVQYLCLSKGEHYYFSDPIYQYRENQVGAMKTSNEGFNKKSISNLYARIECYKIILNVTQNKQLVELARKSIANKYYSLISIGVREGRLSNYPKIFAISFTVFRYISPLYIILNVIRLKRAFKKKAINTLKE